MRRPHLSVGVLALDQLLRLEHHLGGSPFLGLRNYVEALTNASSQFIFAQNIAFTVICIALEFVIGMALALLLSRQFIDGVWRGRCSSYPC